MKLRWKFSVMLLIPPIDFRNLPKPARLIHFGIIAINSCPSMSWIRAKPKIIVCAQVYHVPLCVKGEAHRRRSAVLPSVLVKVFARRCWIRRATFAWLHQGWDWYCSPQPAPTATLPSWIPGSSPGMTVAPLALAFCAIAKAAQVWVKRGACRNFWKTGLLRWRSQWQLATFIWMSAVFASKAKQSSTCF